MRLRLSVGMLDSSAHDTNVDMNDSRELTLDFKRGFARRGVRGAGGPPARIDDVNFLRGVLGRVAPDAGVESLAILEDEVRCIGAAFVSIEIGGGEAQLASSRYASADDADALLAGADFFTPFSVGIVVADVSYDAGCSCRSACFAFCAVDNDVELDERRTRGNAAPRVSLLSRLLEIDLRTVVDVDAAAVADDDVDWAARTVCAW